MARPEGRRPLRAKNEWTKKLPRHSRPKGRQSLAEFQLFAWCSPMNPFFWGSLKQLQIMPQEHNAESKSTQRKAVKKVGGGHSGGSVFAQGILHKLAQICTSVLYEFD